MPKKQDEGISSPYLNSIIKDTISGMSHDTTQHQVMMMICCFLPCIYLD